jgi:alpha-glucosidase
MNEPTSFSLYSDMDLPSDTTYKLEGSGGDHRQAHNLYGLLMNQAGYDALSEARPTKRPWLVSRSGWVSQQRYAWN